MTPEQIIRRPLMLTEKGNRLQEEENQYLFEVHQDANKPQIRDAIEALFPVKVEKVHTMIVRGRMRRMGRGQAKTRNWKKAIVSLREGDTIDFWEGA
ncbi:MAG: 50S ribosomal protein L23 [Myxococcales bacterium]|nr:50S ribosomal protein L23 [Myxococcales bacterium]